MKTNLSTLDHSLEMTIKKILEIQISGSKLRHKVGQNWLIWDWGLEKLFTVTVV